MTTPMIRHGYTFDDLQHITRAACVADRLLAMPYQQRYDVAWSGVIDALYEAEEAPIRQALVRAGWQAIYREVRDGLRQRGYADGDRDWTSDEPTRPRFVQYWMMRVVHSPEDPIIERIATGQVLATLGDPYRDAVIALAVHDDYVAAADALGLRYTALTARLSIARREFLRQWHEGETPHRPRRTDRRVEVHGKELATHCGNNHEWTPENTRWAPNPGRRGRRRFCRECERVRARRRAGAA